jgi:hypothetical protein
MYMPHKLPTSGHTHICIFKPMTWINYMLCEQLSTNQCQVITTRGYQLSNFENIFPELSSNFNVSTQFQKLHLDL